MAQFKPLIIDKSPFDVEPDVDKPSRFRPTAHGRQTYLVKSRNWFAEVAYAEVTSDGVISPGFIQRYAYR